MVNVKYGSEKYKQYRKLFESVQNKSNWKLPTNTKCVAAKGKAIDLANAIAFFAGGAETVKVKGKGYCVSSKGYYHYIGA